MSLFEKIRVVIKEEDAKNPKKSKAQNYSDKINKQNKNRKEFKFDPKSKERQTFRSVVQSGDKKGRGYTIHRGDVKKGETKGIRKSQLRSDNFNKTVKPSGKMEPAWKDFSKRATKGEPKAIQFGIDLKKDFRKERGLGKRAERVTGASGGKKTGTLGKGNLSFPGDRTGAYSTTKSQIEFNKALKKARGGTEGDIPREAPKDVKDYAKGVRDKRIKKLKLPDTSFDAKPSKKPIKPFGNKKVTTSAPGFGRGDTPGQTKIKAMDAKAFKVTQPSDVLKNPELSKTYGTKSFTDFSKKIKKEKSRRLSAKTTRGDAFSRATGTSGSTEGMGGASGTSKTKVVKQSEVSKQAKDFTKAIDKARTKTPVSATSRKTFSKFTKEAETATTNLRKQVDTIAKNPNLTGREKAIQSRVKMKDLKTSQNFARGLSDPKKAQTAITLPKDIKTVQSAAKGPTPPKPQPFTGVTAKGNPSRAISPSFKIGSQATIKDISKQKGA